MRILDCKEEKCKAIVKDAPSTIDYLCEDCKSHHESVRKGLTSIGLEYTVNPRIVRGLDYYTRTVFEFISTGIGAQGTVCGGGRYNDLVEQVGGKPTPAVGFGMGIERLIMVLESLGLPIGEPYAPTVYIAPMCDKARDVALTIANDLRAKGISSEFDVMDRSFKAQMKYADKLSADFVIIIGEDELKANKLAVKNMKTGEQVEINSQSLFEVISKK